MKADIYVNGTSAGGHVGGYTAFDIEITEHVKTGTNEILVRVDNAVDKNLVPSQKADFFQYGGLTRDVWVETRPETFLEQVRVNSDVNADRAIVSLKTYVDGVGDWGPESYRTVITGFGLRWFEFKANGPFFLNGERLLLRGTHLHEGHAGMGSAMTDEQRIADLTAIKDMGANFVRLGHYSHDPVIYDTADELGIILYDEVPWNRGGIGGEEWRENTQEMTRSMIKQNYNRASVFLWSLGNEMYWLPDQEGGGDKVRVAEELQLLHNIAKEMDPGRLTTIRKFPEGA